MNEQFIAKFICNQIYGFFRFKDKGFTDAINHVMRQALERYEYCLSHMKYIKHLTCDMPIVYHADEYCSLLYFVSNELWKQTHKSDYSEKVYLLNRVLNSVDIFYDRELPDIFRLIHPLSTIIGRAKFKNYLVIYQGVTIGGNMDSEFPSIGENVTLYTNSSLIGRCEVGDNCQIGAGVKLINKKVKSGTTLVMKQELIRLHSKRNFRKHNFK